MWPRPTIVALYAVWAIWGASWLIAALWSDRAVAKPAAAREWIYRPFTFGGWILLLVYIVPIGWGRHGVLPILVAPLWRLPGAIEWPVIAIQVAGCGFAWWGRLHLGRLWSVSLTAKADHRVIDTGPYALVRHPIYTGMLTGALATVAIRATFPSLIGFVVFAFGYWLKAREEERFLSGELGAQAYAAYRARVPMLVPYWPDQSVR